MKAYGRVKRSSRILNLVPYLDSDGLIRLDSRVKNFNCENFPCCPIILDANDRFTLLLIKHYHEKFYHRSHETVVNELRQKYWIVGLRQKLRNIVAHCNICKSLRGSPVQPRMAAIPNARLGHRLRAFTYSGLDYFGPLYIKNGKRVEKRYVALFTCLTIRAVHLELANALTADSAIMALRRFSARRGSPRIIYSDNGLNFVKADEELSDLMHKLDYKKMIEHAALNKLEWKFNPPTACHMGGAWESLIKSVKSALVATLKNARPGEEVLRTVLAEIEHSVNSRPLTHVSPDPRDSEALTPNHFMFGSSSGQVQLPSFDQTHQCTQKDYELSQKYADLFWSRWLREYLPTLLARKKVANSTTPPSGQRCGANYE